MKPDLIIYTDGGSRGNPGQAAYGFVVYDGDLNPLFEKGERIGVNTNNVAEYMGVISALRWVEQSLKISKANIHFFLDSELVASQLNGVYKVKNENLRSLFFTAKNLENIISGTISYTAVKRADNAEADRMVNLALDGKA